MRFLLKVTMNTETANDLARAGELGSTIQEILKQTEPEAVYFGEEMGERTAYIIVEMAKASDLPALAEPWFLSFDARVEIHPVMVPEDLASAEGAIESAVKDFG